MDRRQFIRNTGTLLGAGLCGIGLGKQRGWAEESSAAATPAPEKSDSASKLVVVRGADTRALVHKSLEALGGIEQYVKSGNVVVVKPNIAWDRTPEQAANTHPEIVAAVVALCMKAGAKQVKVFDNTCNDARRSYVTSGIEEAAKKEGATVNFVDERLFRKVAFPKGKLVQEWEVYGEALDADVFINIPIAKHHSLSKLTMCMKNHFGVMGGRRGLLHQDIDQRIADLSTLLKPQLSILDATRILKANGPTGGNLEDVQVLNTLIASTDPVAVDSYGATLFGLKGDEIGYIKIANEMGLGKMYPSEIQALELAV